MLKKFFVLVFITSISLQLHADEGMWLPLLVKRLNEADLQKAGCKLTAEEIYSVNHSSLKDAIVSMGGFCTGEMVSAEGLMFTNHHCGYESVQAHSTVENDLLKNGFWAKSHDQELPNPGLFVRFLVRMEDVTDKVKPQLPDSLSETQRQAAAPKIFAKITEEASEGGKYKADVKSMFGGNEFYLFVYEEYKDVRLVGAPPESIGAFGGDTDNWMWPRHTGDFSIFRVYMSPDGKPAPYSKDNVPYKPKHFLPVSIKGMAKEDYAMIMGYPGSTQRYLSSYGVQLALDQSNPTIVKIRDKKLATMKQFMDADHATYIKYTAKYNQTANYWKYFIGQSKGLIRMNVVDQKRETEKKFQAWADADAARKAKYSGVLNNLDKGYNDIRKFNLSRWYLNEAVFQGAEILPFAFQFQSLEKALGNKETKPEEIKAMSSDLKEALEEHFKDYDVRVDERLFANLLKMYHDNVPSDQYPDIFAEVEKKYKGNFDDFAADVFKKTFFASKENVEEFLKNPSGKKLTKDPAYKTINSITSNFFTKIQPTLKGYDLQVNRNNRLFIGGLRQMNPDMSFYPDANSTMRFTYGHVRDYFPMDAVYYNYFTTLDGLMEKKDNSNEEFIVPAKLEELWKKKDYGRYAENGVMKVCFITNNDITGGNSGSPVINGNGELVGLAFDGNWEAMSGDIAYDPSYKRTICVDSRYVLFIIDKFGGATNLINELKIMN